MDDEGGIDEPQAFDRLVGRVRKGEIPTDADLRRELLEVEAFRGFPASVYNRALAELRRSTDVRMAREDLRAIAEGDDDNLPALLEKARTVVDDYADLAIDPLGAGRVRTLGHDLIDPADVDLDLLRTGFPFIDSSQPEGAFERGWVVGIVGPPKLGKSSFALFTVLGILAANPAACGLWCLGEMSLRTLQLRALATLSGLPPTVLRRKELGPVQIEQKRAGMGALRSLEDRLHVLPGPFTAGDIEAAVAAFGPAVVGVDYLQRIAPDDPEAPRREQVDRVSQALSRIAVDHHVLVLAVSCMSKVAADGRSSIASAFKESSGPGYDVDAAYVGALPEELIRKYDAGKALPDRHELTWLCKGHRHGAPRHISAMFERASMRFLPLHRGEGP